LEPDERDLLLRPFCDPRERLDDDLRDFVDWRAMS
jgi:hypothetical protein